MVKMIHKTSLSALLLKMTRAAFVDFMFLIRTKTYFGIPRGAFSGIQRVIRILEGDT